MCASGLAELSFRWDSVQIAGCSFLYYSQYKCAERNVNLLAYWDYGACGPRGDDFDWGCCGGQEGNCPATVSVANSICNSGTANLAYKYDDVTIDGCSYIFYAQYVCTTNLGFLHAQLYDGMTSADWTRFDNSAPAAQWQFPAPLNVDADNGACMYPGYLDNFGVAFTGFVSVPTAGTYRFYIEYQIQ